VFTVVRRLNKQGFVLADDYALAEQLQKLHPGKRHLRDKGLLEFLGRGRYWV
jgi:hypothetical protein